MEFSLEMYKSKVDNDTLNQDILNMIEVLEKYEISYVDSFPINIDPFEFKISDETLQKWKKSNNLNRKHDKHRRGDEECREHSQCGKV